jgi:hypothetical protein
LAITDQPPSLLERYASATRANDLRPSRLWLDEGLRDADILLAAGYASRQDEKGRQALMLNRMLVTGDYNRLPVMAEYAYRWVKSESFKRGSELPRNITRRDLLQVCLVTLRWWLRKVCPHCNGRKFELVYPGAQVTSTKECKPCEGQGRTPLDNLAGDHWREARWLANEFDRLMDKVEQDMRYALSRKEQKQ